ncbi:hypothetical protein NDU88_010332 [Pleurodeles waltl]|uniref:Uncharacterized protein n=1 Tax=Pleurodeles waltl TaxID=8319 RepID=A0AAV7QVK6_PLEWA|nr:hypothetical protein NDU88_010332 [Pleurodeles waltl]
MGFDGRIDKWYLHAMNMLERINAVQRQELLYSSAVQSAGRRPGSMADGSRMTAPRVKPFRLPPQQCTAGTPVRFAVDPLVDRKTGKSCYLAGKRYQVAAGNSAHLIRRHPLIRTYLSNKKKTVLAVEESKTELDMKVELLLIMEGLEDLGANIHSRVISS